MTLFDLTREQQVEALGEEDLPKGYDAVVAVQPRTVGIPDLE